MYRVKYLGGMTLFHEQSEGVLSIDEQKTEFKGRKFNFMIPIRQIIDVTTQETDDAAKALGSYIFGLGMFGVAATRSMNKIRVMTVVFKDSMGVSQKPKFRFLPRNAKEVKFIKEAAEKLTNLSRMNTQNLVKPELEETKAEINTQKGVIVKIRCLRCRNLFDETLKSCPRCGTRA